MRKLKRLFITLAVIITIFVFGKLSLPSLGTFLVADEEPQPSDIIVVLMGSGPDRMQGAVELY
jgi:hypothetical protein